MGLNFRVTYLPSSCSESCIQFPIMTHCTSRVSEVLLIKVQLCLSTPWRQGSGSKSPLILNLGLDSADWPSSCYSHFTSGKWLWYVLSRMLGGHQSISGRFGEDRNDFPYLDSNSGWPVRSLVVNINYTRNISPWMKDSPSAMLHCHIITQIFKSTNCITGIWTHSLIS